MKSYDYQLIIISILIGIFIYFRKLNYYEVLPRENLFISVAVAVWAYYSIKYPWIIILGLIALILIDRFDILL